MTATVQPLAAPAQIADLARRVEALDLDARTEAVLARMCGPVSPRVAALVDRMLPQVPGVPDYEVCLPLPVRVPGAALGDVNAITADDRARQLVEDAATAARILAAVAEVTA